MTKVAMILLVVGGLNWGLVGIFNFDLVNWLFVSLINVVALAKIVYIVVGISAVYVLVTVVCPCCKSGSCSTSTPPQAPEASGAPGEG